eukprot:1367482-Amphidinium_carterae.1
MSSTTVAPLVKPKVQRAAIAKMSARRISKVTQPSRIAEGVSMNHNMSLLWLPASVFVVYC